MVMGVVGLRLRGDEIESDERGVNRCGSDRDTRGLGGGCLSVETDVASYAHRAPEITRRAARVARRDTALEH